MISCCSMKATVLADDERAGGFGAIEAGARHVWASGVACMG